MFGLERARRAKQPVAMAVFAPLPSAGYLVGGAVRDHFLGRASADTDWLVPEPETEARRAAALLSGSAFELDPGRGQWRVVAAEDVRDYLPLAGDLEHDLEQRDFSVNALALDLSGKLHDPCGGLRDLRARTLRLVRADALERDPLRAWRALRLLATLRFRLEPGTRAALESCAAAQAEGRLPLPAWERVGAELERLLGSPKGADALLLAHDLGLLRLALPELAEAERTGQGGFHHLDVLRHSLEALNQLVQGFPEADLALRWATLLHDVGKPVTESRGAGGRRHFYGHARVGAELSERMLTRLRCPERLVRRVSSLIHDHMLPLPQSEREARRFAHRRRKLLPDLLKLMIADREAARGPLSSAASRRAYRLALARVLEILAEPPPKAPLLTGLEVMKLLSLEPGPRVGESLRLVAEAEAVGDVRDADEAEALLRRYAERQGWQQDEAAS